MGFKSRLRHVEVLSEANEVRAGQTFGTEFAVGRTVGARRVRAGPDATKTEALGAFGLGPERHEDRTDKNAGLNVDL